MVFYVVYPMPSANEGISLTELGISYYSHHRGVLGLDHGSKALAMLLMISVPVFLYDRFKLYHEFSFLNLAALVSGTLSFFTNSVSLILQAATVEYAFKIYSLSTDTFTQNFASALYDWSMLQGGLSVSLYIIANLLLSIWVIIHSIGLKRFNGYRKIGMFGICFGVLQILGSVVSWVFLMIGRQNMHSINEIIGFIFIIWLFMVSILLIKMKLPEGPG